MDKPSHKNKNQNMNLLDKYSTRFLLIVILLIGFGLRAYFAQELHPNTEEFYSMLASEAVQNSGLPILPSGLFYTHGFLYSIINGAYIGILKSIGGGWLPEPIHYPYRIPSLYFSVLAIALIYRLGREWFSPFVGLIAAGLLAIAPDMVLWGSLVRMYSLLILLIPLLVYTSYKMISSPSTTLRWQLMTLLVLVATFMSHFLTILFIPPMIIGIGIFAWFQKKSKGYSWILNKNFLFLWSVVIVATISGSVLLQSRSAPPTSLTSTSTGVVIPNLSLSTIVNLISSQLNVSSNLSTAPQFLAEVMWKYPFYSAIFVIVFLGGVNLLITWIFPGLRKRIVFDNRYKMLFLFVVTLGPILELTFFVADYRRNPKYLIIFWPLLFLLVGFAVESILFPKSKEYFYPILRKQWFYSVMIVAIIIIFGRLGKPRFERFLYFNPAAYEEAFSFVKGQLQPEDIVVTPYAAAAGLYLGKLDYFAGGLGSNAAILNQGDNHSIDRYMGSPWIGTGKQFQNLLIHNKQTWFIVSDIIYDHYFKGDWHFVQQQNMELVWKEDSAIIFHSKGQGILLPDAPKNTLESNLGDLVQLHGFTSSTDNSVYRIYLFWNVLSPLSDRLTQFVHIRNEKGETIAQADFEPLNGEYPTTLWKQGETVVDVVDIPISADLPSGEYRVLAGLYRWDTLERIPVINDATGENAVQLEIITIP